MLMLFIPIVLLGNWRLNDGFSAPAGPAARQRHRGPGRHPGQGLEHHSVGGIHSELGVVVCRCHLHHIDPGDVVGTAQLSHARHSETRVAAGRDTLWPRDGRGRDLAS
jgi:hypothetical protein